MTWSPPWRRLRAERATDPGASIGLQSNPKPIVTVAVKAFPPAFRSGGPSRSIAALADALRDEADFRVVTSLDDNGHDLATDGVPPLRWERRAYATVSALPRNALAPIRVVRQIRSTDPDVLYLSSLFDPVFTLTPLVARRLRLLGPMRTVVAPRGELDPGAFALKHRRKRGAVRSLRRVGLTRGLLWHATNPSEARSIRETFGSDSEVTIASNIRTLDVADPPLDLQRRPLQVVFMSKIDRKKNLETAIEAVAAHESAELTVIGPVKDEVYWRESIDLVRDSGLEHRFTYAGPVEPDCMIQRLAEFDLFLLPTRSENFGHAILEALAAGLPVAIGEDTPWADVERKRAGWVLPADSPVLFADCIRLYDEMQQSERLKMRRNATRVAQEHLDDPAPVAGHRQMLLAGERTR